MHPRSLRAEPRADRKHRPSDADDGPQPHAQAREGRGRAERLADDLEGRHAWSAQRIAEAERQETAREGEALPRPRPIEAQLLAKERALDLAGLLAQHQHGRIPRQEAHRQEDQRSEQPGDQQRLRPPRSHPRGRPSPSGSAKAGAHPPSSPSASAPASPSTSPSSASEPASLASGVGIGVGSGNSTSPGDSQTPRSAPSGSGAGAGRTTQTLRVGGSMSTTASP